jgi:chromosome segregation ATPase
MDEAFIDLRRNAGEGAGGDTFWPSFTDIMMVIVMIFMMASTVLVIRNWDLVQELRATIEAEHQAKELARSMTETSATLEEQLAQAQHINSEMRMQLMRAEENRQSLQEQLSTQQQQILMLTEEQQRLATSLQQSRRAGQLSADELARVSADHEQLTATHAAMQERLQQVLDELAASEQTSREQAVELAGLRQGHSLRRQQLDDLQGEYDELQVKYDRLTRPARSAKGKHVVTVRYWKENGHYHLRIRDAGEDDYTVVTRKELHRRLSKLKDEQSGKLYVKLIIPDDSGLSYNEAWGFTLDILNKYDYYHQKQD